MKLRLPSTVVAFLTVICLPLVLAAPSLSGNDTQRHGERIIVSANNVLTGIWRFPPYPRGWLWSQPDRTWLGMEPEDFCRIEAATPAFTFDCLTRPIIKGQASLDEYGNVRLAGMGCNRYGVCSWGNHWVFRGKLESNTAMTGHIGHVHDGNVREKPDRLTITKLVLSERSPDLGSQAAFLKQLLEQMAGGHVTMPYTKPRLFSSNPAITPIPDDQQARLFLFRTPDSLHLLGRVMAVIYVADYAPTFGWDKLTGDIIYSPERSSIYAVEFEHGERLCALHRRPDGVLSQFTCI